MHFTASLVRRAATLTIPSTFAAGCSNAGLSTTGPSVGTAPSSANRSVSANQALASGHGAAARQAQTKSGGWISPDVHKRRQTLIYWGNYDTNTITIYSGRGVNGKQKGQITTGLSEPERLFVGADGSVYATNIGNNTVTGYKKGSTSPFVTISNGVESPTGLTVDAAGTIYCANVGNDTITVYPKGQTSPSETIPYFAEYLATDANDNLYAAGSAVEEFAPGSTTGKDTGLPHYPDALEVDRSGNIIVLYGATVEYFPAGQTSPSKEINVSGSPFGLALSKNNKTLYVTTEVGTPFVVQSIAYPNGSSFSNKLTTNAGGWPISVSPNNALGE